MGSTLGMSYPDWSPTGAASLRYCDVPHKLLVPMLKTMITYHYILKFKCKIHIKGLRILLSRFIREMKGEEIQMVANKHNYYIQFRSEQATMSAVIGLNGRNLEGHRVTVVPVRRITLPSEDPRDDASDGDTSSSATLRPNTPTSEFSEELREIRMEENRYPPVPLDELLAAPPPPARGRSKSIPYGCSASCRLRKFYRRIGTQKQGKTWSDGEEGSEIEHWGEEEWRFEHDEEGEDEGEGGGRG